MRVVAPDGSTVEQFGPVTLDRNEIVLEASVSLCDGAAGIDQYGDDGAVGAPAPADGASPAELPETGGASLATAVGAGALVIGGGLLLRGLRR